MGDGKLFGSQMAFSTLAHALMESGKLKREDLEACFAAADEVLVDALGKTNNSPFFVDALEVFREYVRVCQKGQPLPPGPQLVVDNDRNKS